MTTVRNRALSISDTNKISLAGADMLSEGFATFKEQVDTQNTGRKDIEVDNFYAKNGVYNRFNKLIDFMKERKTEKNIAAVKEYVAGL